MRAGPVLTLMLFCALILNGCVTVDVINLAEVRSRVLIRTPDGSRATRLVEAAGTASTFSTSGGGFTISTLPDEEYRQLLLDIREQLGQRLFTEGTTLTAAEVGEIVSRISQLTEALDALARQGASCSGSVTDFGSVTAILNWDDASQNWVLTCSVQNAEE